MKKLVFLIICSILFSCEPAHKYKIYKTEIPCSSLEFVKIHLSSDKYIIEEIDGIISSGTLENIGSYLVLTDELSHETTLIKIRDEFLVFLNGRFKDLIFCEDIKAENIEDFAYEEGRFFTITNHDMETHKQWLKINSTGSQIDLKGKLTFSNSNDLILYFENDTVFYCLYKGFLMESGSYYQEGKEIYLKGFTNEAQRFDLSEKEQRIIESFASYEYIAITEDDKTIKLGTLPCSRIHNRVYRDSLQSDLLIK